MNITSHPLQSPSHISIVLEPSPDELQTASKTNSIIQLFNFAVIPLLAKALAPHYPEAAFRCVYMHLAVLFMGRCREELVLDGVCVVCCVCVCMCMCMCVYFNVIVCLYVRVCINEFVSVSRSFIHSLLRHYLHHTTSHHITSHPTASQGWNSRALYSALHYKYLCRADTVRWR